MKKQGFSILVVLTLVMAFSAHRSFGKERGVQPASLFRLDYQYGALNPWLFYEAPLSANIGLFYGQNRDQRGVFRMTFLKFF